MEKCDLLLPGVPVLTRLVVIGELGLAASLIAGLWTRAVALLGFLMSCGGESRN